MSAKTTEILNWEPPMPPTDLIFDDGEPLEANRHRIAMNTLIRSLQQAWCDRNYSVYSPFASAHFQKM